MLSANATRSDSWIVDCGAKGHICNNEKMFVDLHSLNQPLEITLGDGHTLHMTKHGIVALEMKLPSGKTKRSRVHDVLYICAKAVLQLAQ